MMDDLYIFFKNDRNFFLKQLHFIISVFSFLFLIITNSIDSVIVALAIPGSVINSALLLGLYCLDERHETTDIEILITYGTLNLLAAMVFVNKTLQQDISIFRMLFLNPYTINILLCLLSGLLMLGEGVYRLIVVLVRNIYNSAQNSQNLNLLFNGKERNSSANISTVHKIIITPDVDSATNTSPSVSNLKTLQNGVTCAEKDTNTNPYEDILLRRNIPPMYIPTTVDNYTECSHYKLNSKHDKHRNSGDGVHLPEKANTATDRRSGDGLCNNDKPPPEKSVPVGETQYFYPKCHRHLRLPKMIPAPNSEFNEAGLPVFVDRYGKKYIASLAGAAGTRRCPATKATGQRVFDTTEGVTTPIDEFYTNRKYSNSKVTITPSKDDVTPPTGNTSDSKETRIPNHNNNNNVANHVTTDKDNSDNSSTNDSNRATNSLANDKHKASESSNFMNNYNNYLAHLYKTNNNNTNTNNNNNNNRKLFNYKFYNHNYDYQWVCEA